MTTSDFDDSQALIEEEATVWLLEREKGFAPDRAKAFAAWRDRDVRHGQALMRVEHTLSLLEKLPVLRGPLETKLAQLPVRRRGFIRWTWTIGFAAALVLTAATWWSLRPVVSAPITYTALNDEPRRISLADGSVLDLNSGSRVEVRFSDDKRQVTLAAGEAHFQVAHNRERPFIVTASGISVRAIGTAFNVRLAGKQVDVLVAEGKVEVARQEDSGLRSSKKNPVIPLLVAGERTQLMSHSDIVPQVDEIAPAELQALLSWQNRMTSFADVPLSEMVARINRCNTLQLVLGDVELGERRVGGVIDLNQVNAFVHLLEQDGDIAVDRKTAGQIVLRRAR